GHSMGECAVVPNIATRIANYCKSGEHTMQSYLKLRFILRDNPQIDTVMFTFAPFVFANGVDGGDFEGDVASNKMKLFYPLMDIEDIKLFLDNKVLYTNLSSMPYLQSVAKRQPYLDQLGGYLYLERDKLQLDIERRAKEPKTQVNSKFNAKYQKIYLSKMIQLCKNYNVKFLFIQFPIYQASKYGDLQFGDSIRKTLYSDIQLLDFVNIQLPDSTYGDVVHLNHRGAKIVSKILMDTLNKNTMTVR
ncbi:MAG: hypothetical protein RR329_07480, partial [Mucinivorans sp.]